MIVEFSKGLQRDQVGSSTGANQRANPIAGQMSLSASTARSDDNGPNLVGLEIDIFLFLFLVLIRERWMTMGEIDSDVMFRNFIPTSPPGSP
jgi:hypothetical protein